MKTNIGKTLFLLLFMVQASFINAQHVQREPLIKYDNKKSKDQSTYTITPGIEMTGLAVRISPIDSFNNSFIINEKDTFLLVENEHDSKPGSKVSELIVFPEKTDEFIFAMGTGISLPGVVEFYFLNASPIPEIPQKKNAFLKDCSKPAMIDQSEWREGLPPPDYDRIKVDVQNVIVHHSAGSNTDTNHVNTVRNIYLYHTGVLEWSDIGYNYLISRNGWIFKGRDPGDLQQDNVQGAHFCSKNSGTMGVCILGNYVEFPAPYEALLSLEALLTWKLFKDTLNPLGINPHPANENLPVIAGHQDGCATLCPGEYLYNLLDETRLLVEANMIVCGYEPTRINSLNNINPLKIYPNPGNQQVNFSIPENIKPKEISVVNLHGQKMGILLVEKNSGHFTLNVNHLKNGIYLLLVSTTETTFGGHFVIYRE